MNLLEVIKELFTRRYWKGFKGRYVLSILLAACLVAILMTTFLPGFVYRTSMNMFRQQSETLNSVLLESIGISLEFGDYGSVQAVFEKIGANEESVAYMDVIDPRGESVARYSVPDMEIIALAAFEGGDVITGEGYIANVRRIEIGGEKYALIIGMDTHSLTELRAYLGRFISLLVWLVVVFIALGMILLVEWLNRPLDVLIHRMEGVATGEADLTREIKVKSDDEFGELSSWFNTFLGRIRELVGQIRDSSVAVTEIGGNIATAAEEMAQGTKSQQDQITDISTSVQEMAATIQEASANAHDALDAAESASGAAVDGGEVVQQTVASMEAIAEAVRSSSNSIGELGQRSTKIGNIVAVIDQIADQTNLLALNASIEAARAGEHGRGFAVVADEVRDLAERTIKATAEIADMISSIQQGTQEVITAMDTGIERVDQGVGLSEKAGEALKQIIDLNSRVQDAVKQIAVGAEQQSATATEISGRIEEINKITGESTNTAQSVAESTGGLRKETEALMNQISLFKL